MPNSFKWSCVEHVFEQKTCVQLSSPLSKHTTLKLICSHTPVTYIQCQRKPLGLSRVTWILCWRFHENKVGSQSCTHFSHKALKKQTKKTIGHSFVPLSDTCTAALDCGPQNHGQVQQVHRVHSVRGQMFLRRPPLVWVNLQQLFGTFNN